MGKEVYWVVGKRIVKGEIVKESKLGGLVWIRAENGIEFNVPRHMIGVRYFESKKEAVTELITWLEVELEDAKRIVSRIPELEKELEYWRERVKEL